MGKGGGGGGDTETTVRFAAYIEDHHKNYLTLVESQVGTALPTSPYAAYVDIDIEDAFFGAGYLISDFPSLYDMFGKFMAGLDVEVLYDQIFAESTDGDIINDLVSAHATELEDEVVQKATPSLTTGLRDINSVMSSTFVVGKAMIETSRVKALSKFSAELRYRMLQVAADRWKAHLEWNRSTVMSYAEIMKLYISAKFDVDDRNYSMDAKDALWPFTVLTYYGQALGALTGAKNITSDVEGASGTAKAIGGALSGAAAGAITGSVVPGIGTAIGAAAGAAIGLAGGLLS